jgi:hypothetical protein
VSGGQNWNVVSTVGAANFAAVPLCGSGRMQSPINIPDSQTVYDATLTPLNVTYGETTGWSMEITSARARSWGRARLFRARSSWGTCALPCCCAALIVLRCVCAGNYLEVASIDTVTTGAGVVTANAFTDGFTPATGPYAGVFLPLSQFHFHTPSEHTINGVHYPFEMHMVHKLFTSDGTLTGTPVPATPLAAGAGMAAAAVIGIMFAYECAPARMRVPCALCPNF